MIRIWGNADSVNVQKVVWCCEEAKVPYLRIDAGRHFGLVREPEFLARNPNGLVPTIEDDGLVVWESNAIVRYLAAKYSSGGLWSVDAASRSRADRWMDWTNSTLWPTMRPLFRAYMRSTEEQRDTAVVQAALGDTEIVLEILDRHLEAARFIAGEDFTMGDIAVGPPIWRWYALPISRRRFPHLDRWFESLGARPAYRGVVMGPSLR